MADLEKKAKEAFIDDHFELAVDLYTQAIALDPTNPDLFADRAQANIKLNKFTEAVADASKAIELDASLAKAYLRKGWKYQNAKAALEAGTSLVPGESRFTNLIKECDELIAEETGESKNHAADAQVNTVSRKDAVPEDTSTQAPLVIPSKPKYRRGGCEYICKAYKPVGLLLVSLSVSVEVPGEDGYHFQPRLFGKIKPDECKYNILSTKVEFRLAKAEPGLHWASLEYNKQTAVVQRIAVSSEIAQRPTYPSSKPKRVDWDKIEAQVKKEEKEEKLDGDAALNSFFRGIYQDADEDTRRAMKKSFVESNGTVLSTNWKEVGTKKVEGSPPDGMEMRKWEY
uniref:Uncharacterized protein n=1 Tax=Salix viminalis TaxID=40686 RepID=A0A6N2N9C7_SALVM